MPSSILNSDDGVISGTSGLKSSGGDDGALAVQSNGTELAKFKTTELVINDGGANYDFRVEGDTDANALFVDASTDRVGIGTSSPTYKLQVESGSTENLIYAKNTNPAAGQNAYLRLETTAGSPYLRLINNDSDCSIRAIDDGLAFQTDTFTTERARIDSGGNFLVGKTSIGIGTDGVQFGGNTNNAITETNDDVLYINRLTSDGSLIVFRQDNTTEGSISVSGSTVSYNGGHLARWAQTTTAKDESLKKGTVLSNLDEMNVYIAPTTYWTEEDELPEGVNVGDVKVETHEVENEQLNKVKVSDVEGDPNVAGVFVDWYYDKQHEVDEINMAMTGDMIIRIAQGTTVARGDLLMSAGDGTAKPQGDDIVRSKTIAKVTSTHVTCTYDDGSYCVPCVLMAC
jgi:hypothetical protein